MANWIDAYDHYLNDVPGCTYTLAANKLRKAAQVFCEQTRAWRVTLDPVMTLAKLTEYEFDMSSEQEIVRVLSVKLNGEPFPIVLEGQQDGHSSGFLPRGPFVFSIFPAQPKGALIEIHAAIRPSNTASGLDRELYRAYINIIAAGAKAELFGMSNQPFTNPAAAQAEQRKFEDGINKTLAEVATKYSSARQRVKASFM